MPPYSANGRTADQPHVLARRGFLLGGLAVLASAPFWPEFEHGRASGDPQAATGRGSSRGPTPTHAAADPHPTQSPPTPSARSRGVQLDPPHSSSAPRTSTAANPRVRHTDRDLRAVNDVRQPGGAHVAGAPPGSAAPTQTRRAAKSHINARAAASITPEQPYPYALAADGTWVPTPRQVTASDYRAWFCALVRCHGRTLYVSGRGDDRNSGTRRSPLRQISAAVLRAHPGDLILVGPGMYGYTEVRGFRGSPDNWLAIMAADDSGAARINVPPPTDNFVNIIDSQFVGIFGFEVYGDQRNPNTNGSGISVYGNSHHIAIWRNHVHDFPGGGINCFDVDGSHDLLDISYNTIHATSRYSPSNTSGISVCASRDLTRGELFAGGYGHRIVGNYVYDVLCTVPYRAGGFDCVTDGNGISLDRLASAHGYRKPVLVAGNIVTSCGGRGALAYETTNVQMINNTAVGNLRTDSPAINGGTELQGKTDRSVRITDNVICPLHTPNSTDALSTYRGNRILGGTQRVRSKDIDLRRLGMGYFIDPTLASSLTAGPPRAAFAARSDRRTLS